MQLFRYILLFTLATVLFGTVEARQVFNLNNGWRFFFTSENSSDEARYVRIPHTWNHDALHSTQYNRTVGNYRRSLYVPAEWKNKRIYIRFAGVQSVANLFVNGQHAGEHRGGWTAFTFDITKFVTFGGENSVLVMVSNAFNNDVLPTSTEENLYGGIYRDVELVVTDRLAVSPAYYGTEGVIVSQKSVSADAAEGSVEVAISCDTEQPQSVTLDILSPDGYVAVSKSVKSKITTPTISIPYVVPNPELWSPSLPRLYTVRVTVGRDTVAVGTGFRSIAMDKYNRLTINGKPCRIKGVNLHHDHSVEANALSEERIRTDMATIRDMGANAIRSATAPHAQQLYNMCDKTGVLVWIDTPFTQSPFFSDIAFIDSPRFRENGLQQLREIVLQNMNHPSVAMWGIFSLLRGGSKPLLDYVAVLNREAKHLDASRPTVACSNQDGDINFITDLIVWQQSVGWERGNVSDLKVWQEALKSNWSHLHSAIAYGEGGTIGEYNENLVQRTSSQHRIPESWQRRFHEGYVKYLEDGVFWGVWLNSMFDFGSARYRAAVRNSGLVAFDHQQRKDAFYLYRTLWNTQKPTLHIVGKGRKVRNNPRQVLSLYSSYGQPMLLLNGDTVAVHQLSNGHFVTDTLTLQRTNKVLAITPQQRDSVEITIGNYIEKVQK